MVNSPNTTMSLWRTNPSSCLENSRLLAQKIQEVGWGNLADKEKAAAERFGIEVCRHLPVDQAQEIADVLKLQLPDNFVPEKQLKPPGKIVLLAKIREAFRQLAATR